MSPHSFRPAMPRAIPRSYHTMPSGRYPRGSSSAQQGRSTRSTKPAWRARDGHTSSADVGAVRDPDRAARGDAPRLRRSRRPPAGSSSPLPGQRLAVMQREGERWRAGGRDRSAMGAGLPVDPVTERRSREHPQQLGPRIDPKFPTVARWPRRPSVSKRREWVASGCAPPLPAGATAGRRQPSRRRHRAAGSVTPATGIGMRRKTWQT